MNAQNLLLAACLALGACAGEQWDLAAARSAPEPGDPFQKALRAEYLRLAQFERDEFDWTDLSYFLRRAETARDAHPAVAALSERELAIDQAPPLEAARERLMKAFEDGGREAEPAEAARAQAGFECWLEQQEEAHQPAHIAACRKQYEAAIAAVEEALKPPPLKSMVVLLEDEAGSVGKVVVRGAEGARTLDQPRLAARLDKVRPRWRKPFELEKATVDARFGRALSVPREVIRRYVLYFEDNSVELTPESKALLPEAIDVIGSSARKKVTITGHADRFGSEGRNHAMAFHRALEIRDMLLANGIGFARVAASERGERAPQARTPDGVKAAANRRVVIDFE